MPTKPPLLLIGASGRVGRMLCHHWPQNGANQTEPGPLICQQRQLPLMPGGLEWSPLDGPRQLLDHLDRTGQAPAALLMLAGVTPAPRVSELALQANAALAQACLSAAHAAGIGRVLLASSSAVYGIDPSGEPFNEGHTPNPIAPYGRAKLAMEACAPPWRAQGVEVCALRIGNVAGADALLGPLTGRRPPQGSLPTVQIHAFGDGLGPLRSYIGPQTLARVLAALATHPAPLPEVVNLAAPVPVRMTDLVTAARWPYALIPAPVGAHQNITLDCGRLQGLVDLTNHDSQPRTMVQQWNATWI